MASLTDYLPTVNDGKKVQQPYDPGPSIFEGIAKGAALALDMQEGAAETQAKRDKARRQAQQDALDAEERGAKNFVAEAILTAGTAGQAAVVGGEMKGGVQIADPNASGGNPLPVSPAEQEEIGKAQSKGDQIGQQAAVAKQGVTQGRISAAQYEMMLERALREGFRLFPNSKYIMLEEVKKYGIDHPVMGEYRAAEKEVDRQAAAQSQREESAIDYAITKYGMDPNRPRETLIAAGFRGQAEEAALARARAEYDFNEKKAGNDQQKLKSAQQVRDSVVSKFVNGALAPQFGAALDEFNTVIADPTIPEAERIKAASEFINVFRPKAYSLIDQNLLIAVNNHGMTQETADKERTRLRAQVDDIFTQFSTDNPLNRIVTNGKILQHMKDSWGLDVQDAAPIFTKFKEALGSTEAVEALVNQVSADPELQSVFTRELTGIRSLVQGDQTIRLRNLLAFTTDRNTSLKDYTPQQSAQIIKDSAGLLNKGLYKLAINGDTSSQKTVLNTLGKVANAAVDLNKGTSTAALVNAINFVANGNAYDTLMNLSAENKEFGGLVADEMRVATGKALMSLMQQRQPDPNFQWKLNDQTRKFEIIASSTPRQVPFSREGGTGAQLPMNDRTPSKELVSQVNAMNRGLTFLMASTGFEDNPTLKNASGVEKYRFYTRGEMPESAKPKPGDKQSGRERISRLQNFWEKVKVDWNAVPKLDVEAEVDRQSGRVRGVAFNADGSRSATNLAGKAIKIESPTALKERHSSNPIFQSLVSQAKAAGIPEDVAIRLGAVETGNQFNDPGGNSAGAYGPMQVVARLHNGKAQEMFGKNVPELTPQENIKLGLRILLENYKKRNSWLEAAHDYIGRGKDDGNMYSADYAQLIAGEPDES